MTRTEAIAKMKNYFRLPLPLYDRDPDTYDRAIQNALDIINQLTGGMFVEGYGDVEPTASWVAYGESVLYFPDGILDEPGATSYVSVPWTLDNIDKNPWLLPKFIELAAELANIDAAGKLEVADGIQESPIQFNFNQIAEDAHQRRKDLEEDIRTNWVAPLV